jgi:hypothetical protein
MTLKLPSPRRLPIKHAFTVPVVRELAPHGPAVRA